MKFGQQLIGEFNLDWGLESYVGYKDLKSLLAKIANNEREIDDFFNMAERDLSLVCKYFVKLEVELLDMLKLVRGKSRERLKKTDIFEAFIFAKSMLAYQELNRLCFEKIMKKFHKVLGLRPKPKIQFREGQEEEAPSGRQLTKQEKMELRIRCETFTETIDSSYLMIPEKVDLAATFQEMNVLYAEAFLDADVTLSEGVLEKVWQMDNRSQPRIIDYVDAHFYKAKLTKREAHYACKVISCNTNRTLARNITRCLGHKSLTAATVDAYANGECNIQVLDNIRGDDVFVVQSMTFNDEVSLARAQMEMLLMIHTCRLSSAARITAVMPYMAYQSKKQSMSACASMIGKMGADRVLTVDLLAGQIQGYFENVPLDNVKTVLEFVKYFKEKFDTTVEDYATEVCIVSPRSTAVERAREFADEMGCGLATVIRRRKEEENEHWKFTEVSEIVGDVKGKICIIMSCILDEGENLAGVAEEVVAAGATLVYACAVHGVLAGEAMQRLNKAPIEECVVTDTICQDERMGRSSKLRVIPVAPLLAECIDRIHCEASIGMMHKSRTACNTGTARRVSSMAVLDEANVMEELRKDDMLSVLKRQELGRSNSPTRNNLRL
eukprot:TRINITY_DN30457_c0_g1_i1.p1 TRINITY_DN30457_c0_g1~~TRINITY_DN30457_c0_g1_i1.p1  ORF type:complete len:610 (+),score=128.88 TRINITY_DN30457_c0_g1_i1:61-1890(+)